MRNIDKNTCFDLKQLSLFVKKELDADDYKEISNHLNNCEECSETVENVKSFYFVDTEAIADFSPSEKKLTLITFKHIFKENLSLLRSKMRTVLNSLISSSSNIGSGISYNSNISSGISPGSNIGSDIIISRGSNPVLTFYTSVFLILAMIFSVSILFIPKTDLSETDLAETDLSETDLAETDLAETDLVKTLIAETLIAETDLANTESALTDYYSKKIKKINQSIITGKTLSKTLNWEPFDEIVMVRLKANKYMQANNGALKWEPHGDFAI